MDLEIEGWINTEKILSRSLGGNLRTNTQNKMNVTFQLNNYLVLLRSVDGNLICYKQTDLSYQRRRFIFIWVSLSLSCPVTVRKILLAS